MTEVKYALSIQPDILREMLSLGAGPVGRCSLVHSVPNEYRRRSLQQGHGKDHAAYTQFEKGEVEPSAALRVGRSGL